MTEAPRFGLIRLCIHLVLDWRARCPIPISISTVSFDVALSFKASLSCFMRLLTCSVWALLGLIRDLMCAPCTTKN